MLRKKRDIRNDYRSAGFRERYGKRDQTDSTPWLRGLKQIGLQHMTITMNVEYFEEAGIRCPHCRSAQLTKDHIKSRMRFGGVEVLMVECGLCHSSSTIREKSDAPKTQDQTYALHRYRK